MENLVKNFNENGFVKIEKFLTREEVEELKRATTKLVEKYCQEMPISVFSSSSNTKPRDEYFAGSGDKIRGFYEEKAIGSDGKVLYPTEKALNKIGHGLHKFDSTFRSITFSTKVKEILKNFTSMKKPTVAQSMVIFKQPKIGGKVKPHQDSSFLYLEPTPGSLLGFWISLDGANEENGCLYFLPRSHHVQFPAQRFVKNPEWGSKEGNPHFVLRGEDIVIASTDLLVPVEVNPGDLVLIDGLVIHQSEENTSDRPRLAYTFHALDGEKNYSEENWLQPTSENTFMPFPNFLDA